MKPAAAHKQVERWRENCPEPAEDDIAEEVPVSLEYNGLPFAVMLATPLDLEDFALGFSLSEGILADAGQLLEIKLDDTPKGIRIRMSVSSESSKPAARNMAGRTGCGLCGIERLEEAIRIPRAVPDRFRMSSGALHLALESMPEHQVLQKQTGATHAAAWVSGLGEILCVREDVGRHNALDKLIGFLASKGTDFSDGAVLITSRASCEMVQKASTMGIELMAAVSAPTNLARDLAVETGLTLIGFARRNGHTVYANPHRMDYHGY
ncbi:MAG: sulfurtransferase FdhD [Burkholderiales bacterium 21-58-4]|nr:MAG: sulfurtransferase FdhD [Burkholderiales bacterium 21-58-4]HQT25694.1 formate dehydrogenase accessory sulfurtransferase FdhD [Burkholderiales bacterium]